MTTREIMYENKRQYVVSTLKETLSVMPDFGGIQYVHESQTDQEFIKIYDIIGGVIFLNVTGMSLEAILSDIAYIILHKRPSSIVMDTEEKRKIANLIR